MSDTTDDDVAIRLEDVWVQYMLRHAHHYNFKRTLTNLLSRRREEPEVVAALSDVSLQIPRGGRMGLTGPNGSGKSTLLAVMAGALHPSRGAAQVDGRVLALLGGPDEGLDPEQSGRENVLAIGMRFGKSAEYMREHTDEIQDFSGLGRRFDHPVYSYSAGMQVRLRFSAITALDADVLLVDEGIGAADAEFNARAEERLMEFYSRAGTLVIASHDFGILERLTDSHVHLSAGRVLQRDSGLNDPVSP